MATLAGATPGTPPMRMPRPPWGFSKIEGAHLGRHAARHLAHGLEQGQLAVGCLHRFIGDARDALFQQLVGEAPVGRQMQIGEEQEVTAQEFVFRLDRLFDLDDQLRRPGGGGFGHDLGARGAIFFVGDGTAKTGAAFHQHAVAASDSML